MLIGEYSHNLDIKGRMNFPSKLREVLGDVFIVTKGLDECLFVYSVAEWEQLSEKIKALPLSKARNLQRFFFSGAIQIEPDKQGRILLPSNLREYATLEKEVMVIGASNRAEIWNKSTWDTVCASIGGEDIEGVMDELGF